MGWSVSNRLALYIIHPPPHAAALKQDNSFLAENLSGSLSPKQTRVFWKQHFYSEETAPIPIYTLATCPLRTVKKKL